jgi:hypothetical protein
MEDRHDFGFGGPGPSQSQAILTQLARYSDEYCPNCDNHFVIDALTPKAALKVESEDTRMDARYVEIIFFFLPKMQVIKRKSECSKMSGFDSPSNNQYSMSRTRRHAWSEPKNDRWEADHATPFNFFYKYMQRSRMYKQTA